MNEAVLDTAARLRRVRPLLQPSGQEIASEKAARRAIAEFENTQWFLAAVVAFVIDCFFDLFSVVPIFGLPISLLSLPLVLYMIIFNFRHGAIHAKIMRFLILLVDVIPVISLLWLGNLFIVFLMWNHARRKKNKAQKYLQKQAKKKVAQYALMEA